jgi:drug/metabolite transporter (DMT)-like permease
LTEKAKAHLGLVGTNLFFASNYSAIKYFIGHHYAGPFGINLIRIGISLILFWILFLFSSEKTYLKRGEIIQVILCAVAAIALNQMLFIKGLALTFSMHAALLTLMTPIMITILASRILKESLTREKVISLFLGVSGAILLIALREPGHPGENIPLGDLLVILSSLAYTMYFILVKSLMNKYAAIKVMRLVFTFGFFMVLPLSYKEFSEITWQLFGFNDWLLLFLITIPGTFLAYVFNAYGIQKLSASIAGAYIYSQPVFAVIIAMIFLKEQLSLLKIVAALLIFSGVFLSNRKVKNS